MRERMTAMRTSIADIINGTYGEDTGPHVLSPLGVELRRVVVLGFIIDKYVGQGDFASITIDDGTETIRAKAWGSEASMLEHVDDSILALIVGKVREYENEVYIVPEIVRPIDNPNFLTLHLLERYKAILSYSGVTSVDTLEHQKEIASLIDSNQEESASQTSLIATKPSSEISGSVAEQVLQFVEQHAKTEGVSIQDIVTFFEARGHTKSDIHLKVIELQEQEKIIEVKIGQYVPAKI